MSSSVDNPQVLAEATAQDVPVYKRKGKAKSTVAPDSGSDSGTGSGIGPADGEVFFIMSKMDRRREGMVLTSSDNCMN